MKRNILSRMISITLIIGLLLGACGAQPATAPVSTEAPSLPELPYLEANPSVLDHVVVSPNLKLLDRNVVAQMTLASGKYEPITAYQLDQTGGVIKLANVDLTQVKFVQDQIITSGITEETPYGLLRKVVKVDTVGANAVDLTTVQATLEEAIQDGEFSATYSDIVSSFNPVASRQGNGTLMRVASMPAVAPIEIPINEVLYDDGKGGLVKATGRIEVTPDFNLNFMILKAKMEKFVFTDKTTVNANINIMSGIEYSTHVTKKVYEQSLATVPIPVASTGLVVVITPRLIVSIGLDGKVSAGISIGAEYKNTIEVSVSWEKKSGAWDLKKDTNPVINFFPPAFKTKGSAKIYAQPRLELMLFGVMGPYAQVDGYYRFDASPGDNPWWTLKAGVDGKIGVSFDLFGFIKLNPLSEEFTIYEKIIAEASSEVAEAPEVPPPATEPPAEIPPTEEPQATAPPEESNPPGGNGNPADSQPPVATGNENALLVYDDTSAHVINTSQGYIKVDGVVFNRIDNQGNITATYPADMWGNFYTGYDSVPPNYCLRIALPKSPSLPTCTTYVNFETRQEKYHFWRATSESTQFQVLKNGELLQICEISAGSCSFYLP